MRIRFRMKSLFFRCCVFAIAVIIYRNWNSSLLSISSIYVSYDDIHWRDKVPSIIEIPQAKSSRHGVQKISSALDEMSMLYPSFIWFYTGWVQDLDVRYDINQWNQKQLVVHVIPFSHNDPGWLSTYEEYFSARTNNILNVVLNQLNRNQNMTFVWSEICYLKMWFDLISLNDKEIFRRLLKSGRFEIVTGGLVMPDEAIVSYYSFFKVLSEGHIWLKNEFNYSVNTAWSLDSFGHSSTYAHILRSSGIKQTFIQRTHYALKKHLAFKKNIEFYWMQPWDEKKDKGLFTHMSPFLLYSLLYSCGPNIRTCCQFEFVKGRCWKQGNYHKTEEVTGLNIQTKSLSLLEMLRKKSQFVRHNNVMLLVGDDFSFDSKSEWDFQWRNLQKMFDYLNGQTSLNVEIIYSTLGNYLSSSERELQTNHVEIPKFEGDFFPYSDRSDQYWSGFYSTRPKLKSLIRKSQSYLRTSEIFFGFILLAKYHSIQGMMREELKFEINKLREQFTIYQHHDTITGTSKLHVINATQKRLLKSHRSFSRFLNKLSTFLHDGNANESEHLHLLSGSSGLFDVEHDEVLIIPQMLLLFNPLASTRTEVIRMFVNKDNIQVIDQNIKSLVCQTNPAFYKDLNFISETFEVHIQVVMEPLGLLQINLLDGSKDIEGCVRSTVWTDFVGYQSLFSDLIPKKSTFVVSNSIFEVHFDGGVMKKIVDKSNKITKSHEITLKYLAYNLIPPLNPYKDKSGAYIFIAHGQPLEVRGSEQHVVLVEGNLKSFVAVTISPEVVQIIEIFHCCESMQQSIHVSNIVDIRNKGNYEISMLLETSIDNDYFFTDLNGYQMMKRKWRRKFGIQGNFYPMTSMAFIEDDRNRVTLATGQCHAVTSRRRGQLEVMLDRRLLQDDWRGLNEGITDNVPITSTFSILLENFNNKKATDYKVPKPSVMADKGASKLNDPLVVLHRGDVSSTWISFDGNIELPCGVNLVSWRVIATNETRLEFMITLHYQGLDSNILYFDTFCFSKTVQVPASEFIYGQKLLELYEMTLTGSQIISRVHLPYLAIKQMEIKTWLFIVVM